MIEFEFKKPRFYSKKLSVLQAFDADKPTQTSYIQNIGVLLLEMIINLRLHGHVEDAYQKPKQNLELLIDVKRRKQLNNFKLNTDNTGMWEIKEVVIEMEEQIWVTMKYVNEIG